jgi:hypothetical protein
MVNNSSRNQHAKRISPPPFPSIVRQYREVEMNAFYIQYSEKHFIEKRMFFISFKSDMMKKIILSQPSSGVTYKRHGSDWYLLHL